MGRKGGGLLHQAQKATKQQRKKQQGPAAKRHKTTAGSGPSQTSQRQKQNQPHHQQKKKAPQPKQHTEPTIPFSPEESILLLGEGDLSFAASLATHHGCTNLTATVLERNIEELTEKYPHVQANIAKICPPSPPSSPRNSATPETEKPNREEKADGEEEGEEEEDSESDHSDQEEEKRPSPKPKNYNKVLYNIDARKFPPFVRKPGGVGSPAVGTMDRIIFNFPHVGGKSTDVNRQVRYNQELLVDFFKRAVLSLSPGGSIIVTLFESEPYTLWNIRDLARHSGLQVERSFKFQAAAYPGYGHVRTLGVLRDKRSGEITGGGWKGEERPARSYVFVRKGEEGYRPPGRTLSTDEEKKRKRGGEEEDDSSSSEDEDGSGDECGEKYEEGDSDGDE